MEVSYYDTVNTNGSKLRDQGLTPNSTVMIWWFNSSLYSNDLMV